MSRTKACLELDLELDLEFWKLALEFGLEFDLEFCCKFAFSDFSQPPFQQPLQTET